LKVGSKIPVNVCVGNTTQRHRMPQETEWGVVESLDKRKESEVERKRESQLEKQRVQEYLHMYEV
jgi:hypothetical protein